MAIKAQCESLLITQKKTTEASTTRKLTLKAWNGGLIVLSIMLYLNNIYIPINLHLKGLNCCHHPQPHESKHIISRQ